MFDPHAVRWLRRHGRGATIGPHETEQLLDGTAVDGRHAYVAAVLATASAPAQPWELAGERAAVDAFTAAYRPAPAAVAPPARRRTGRTALAALIAVSASLAAGTAYAAHSGHLPGALQRGAHSLFSGVGVPAPAASPAVSHSPTGGPRTASPAAPRPAGTPSASPEQLLTLCQTWIAVRDDPHAGPITAAQRHELAAAAGGESGITAFCEHLLEPTPIPTAHATKPGNPSPGRTPSHPGKPSHP